MVRDAPSWEDEIKVCQARLVRFRARSLRISATLAVVGLATTPAAIVTPVQRLRRRFPIAGAGQYLIVQPADDGHRWPIVQYR